MTLMQLLWRVIVPMTVLPIVLWLQQTGELGVYMDGTAPPGQLPYVLSKLVGMLALVFMVTQMMLSLCQRLRFMDISWLGQWHRWFGITVVLFAFTHLLLFFMAVSVRQQAWAFNLFLPDFRDFYHTHLTFGLLGLWLLIAVAFFGRVRRKIRSPWAAYYHRLYWLAIVAIYFHALAVGSEAQSSIGFVFYLFLGWLMVILGVWSLVHWLKPKGVALS